MGRFFLLTILIISGILLSGCNLFSNSSKPVVTAYKPQYISATELYKIAVKPAEGIQKPGKMLLWDKYLFVNDIGVGFHIINNQNPTVPQSLKFVSVPASSELALKNGFLITNNADRMVVFDLSNLPEVSVIREIPNVFTQYKTPSTPTSLPRLSQNAPTYFECPDPTKGTVIGWVATSMEKPKCSF